MRGILLLGVALWCGAALGDGVAPLHAVELGASGVDADAVRKTVKEVEYKDTVKGAGKASSMDSALKQVELNVLNAGKGLSAPKAAAPVQPKPKPQKAPKSLGETNPQVKVPPVTEEARKIVKAETIKLKKEQIATAKERQEKVKAARAPERQSKADKKKAQEVNVKNAEKDQKRIEKQKAADAMAELKRMQEEHEQMQKREAQREAEDAQNQFASHAKEQQEKVEQAHEKKMKKDGKGKGAKEKAYKKGLKDGEDKLKIWKSQTGIPLNDAIAHAKHEANHTSQDDAIDNSPVLKAKEKRAAKERSTMEQVKAAADVIADTVKVAKTEVKVADDSKKKKKDSKKDAKDLKKDVKKVVKDVKKVVKAAKPEDNKREIDN